MIGALRDLLRPGVPLCELERDLYSVLPPGASQQRFDREAGFYDALVGNRLYLRLTWDNAPADFSRFAGRAMRAGGGPYLDAGCGSLLFTGRLYRRHLDRPAVLVDKSLGMLRQARKKLAGS